MSYKKHIEDKNCHAFIDLFQFIQCKTYSEAMCETVGSIMNIHRGRGRNLHPVNYSKELFLKFNLPPLHHLAKTFIPSIVKIVTQEEEKTYHRRLDAGYYKYKLKFNVSSATIGNFRNKEELKSHLPLCFTEPNNTM